MITTITRIIMHIVEIIMPWLGKARRSHLAASIDELFVAIGVNY